MAKNFYAIKCGNNVKDLIVTSWEECQKYVLGYPAIFKGFDDRISAENYLNSMNAEDVTRGLAVRQQFADYRTKNKYKKRENKTLKLVYEKYEGMYDTVSNIMDRLMIDEYTKQDAYNDLNEVEATIMEGLDALHKYIIEWEERN